MQNLFNDLKTLLHQDDRLVVDGKLLKNKIIELALAMDGSLLKLLLSHTGIKKHFFSDVEGVLVFDKIKFQKFISNKQFLPNSYTAFKNKIGLTANDEFITESKEIVLAWPYKDCVLEGGQTKDDAKRSEIFWNETLAPDEIDLLLSPKVLTNFKKYDKDGEHSVSEISLKDNLIIKGNNLLSLHSLLKKYRGKIRVIYIDPPYNPDSKSNTFCYNNSFNETSWLTFMKNRLEVAKQLLTNDGVLIVAIDENEQAALGVLLKEIFKNHELHCITIVHNPRGVQGTNFSYTHEYAFFVIPQGKKSVNDRKIANEDIEWSNLRNWGSESLREDAKNCFYPIIINPKTSEIVGFGDVSTDDFHPDSINIKDGVFIKVYPIDPSKVERKWRYAKQSVNEVKHLLRARIKSKVWDIEIGKDFGQYKTVWIDTRYDANEYGTKIVKSLVPDCKFDFPKSLYNVHDCLHAIIANDKNAIVLDFFGGSGTTAHALLELNNSDKGNRKFILCEQMHYVETVTRQRVWQVIKNNQNESFIFCELAKANQEYIDKIQEAANKKQLQAIWATMQEKAFISYNINIAAINDKATGFDDLTLEEQQKFLIEILDKNLLYVPYTSIDDKDYNISDEDKKLNRQFYSLK
jgi:adenine-specific DNA-methyltransferase